MTQIFAVVGDEYHQPDPIAAALAEASALLGAELTVVSWNGLDAAIDREPAILVMAREDRLVPRPDATT